MTLDQALAKVKELPDAKSYLVLFYATRDMIGRESADMVYKRYYHKDQMTGDHPSAIGSLSVPEFCSTFSSSVEAIFIEV